MPIDEFCAPIRAALAKLPPHVRVIAEPGRFIAAPAAIAVSSVMGKAKRDGRWWYYLDDGLYGSYSGQMFDHAKYPVSVLREGGGAARERARRPDLRLDRRDRRQHHAAGAGSRRPGRGPHDGRLHLGERHGLQLLQARQGRRDERAARGCAARGSPAANCQRVAAG